MKRKNFLKGGAIVAFTLALAVTGATAATFRAVVDANGNLLQGNAVSATGGGSFIVTFSRKVKACSFTATLGDGPPGIPANGFATVAGANGNPYAVYVATFNSAGTQVGRGFNLIVRC